MTREQFLSGTVFQLANKLNYKSAPTYYYKGNIISEQSRSAIDGRVVVDNYCLNILEITEEGFTGFTFVMGEKALVSYKFSELKEFKEEPVLVS